MRIYSGVAGLLAARCGGQICRPFVFVLGFGNWRACVKHKSYVMSINISILVSSYHNSMLVQWTSVFKCNYLSSRLISLLQHDLNTRTRLCGIADTCIQLTATRSVSLFRLVRKSTTVEPHK